MTFSLNEVEMAVRRAAVGAGLPTGLAVETGRAAGWLCIHGAAGVEAALAALDPPFTPADLRVTAAADGKSWRFPDARVAVAGPSALDLLLSDDGGTAVHLTDADSPWLLIGMAGIAAADTDRVFGVASDGEGSAELRRDGLRLSGSVPTAGTTVVLTCRREPTANAVKPSSHPGGFIVDPQIWAQVQALAALTYVPSTDMSRAHGAGAGTVDDA